MAEPFKEDYGSKRAVLPMMMMMMTAAFTWRDGERNLKLINTAAVLAETETGYIPHAKQAAETETGYIPHAKQRRRCLSQLSERCECCVSHSMSACGAGSLSYSSCIKGRGYSYTAAILWLQANWPKFCPHGRFPCVPHQDATNASAGMATVGLCTAGVKLPNTWIYVFILFIINLTTLTDQTTCRRSIRWCTERNQVKLQSWVRCIFNSYLIIFFFINFRRLLLLFSIQYLNLYVHGYTYPLHRMR
jgi:hypothetical protein